MLSNVASIAFFLQQTTKAAQWTYDDDWVALYAECGDNRQSPIDLPSMSSTCPDQDPLQLDWHSENAHYVIRNTGYSLLAVPFAMSNLGDISGLEILSHTNDTNMRLNNKFYDTYDDEVHREYCFDSLHFHWAEQDNVGSEHTVDGQSFPLEVHFVHYACDYPSAADAINAYVSGEVDKYDDNNVLAVIGVIFEIGAPNPVLDKILTDTIIDGIYDGHDDYDEGLLQLYYTEFDITDLLPESRDMTAYLGSLTTPPCLSTVRWHVMNEMLTVSPTQMEQFRMLLTDNQTVFPNYRPVQELHDRTVFQCDEQVHELTDEYHEHKHAKSNNTTMLVLLVFGILYVAVFIAFCVAYQMARKEAYSNVRVR